MSFIIVLGGPCAATIAAKLRSTSESDGSRIVEAKGLTRPALTNWLLQTFPLRVVTEVPIE